MDDPAYGALLGAYGTNLLYRTGSRPARRQHDSWVGAYQPRASEPAARHPAQRHPAARLANVIGGVGLAVTKDPERFQRLYQTSPRFGAS